MSLRKACIKADISTHSAWINLCASDQSVADQYARARLIGYEMLAEQLIDSLDDDETDPARLRIQVDTRKWMLSKMLPKIYGDRLDLNHSGTVSTQNLTRAELMAIAAQGKTQGGDAAETPGGGSE
jgi:hypothetical protein